MLLRAKVLDQICPYPNEILLISIRPRGYGWAPATDPADI